MENMQKEIEDLKAKVAVLEKQNDSLISISNMDLLKNNPDLFFLLTAADEDILYVLIPNSMLFVFQKKGLHRASKFMNDYFSTISRHKDWECKYGVLNENCELYKELAPSFKENALVYKYVNRHGLINRSLITDDENGLYVENEYLGMQNYRPDNGVIYANQEKRKILDGITVEEYIQHKSSLETRVILRNMYDSMFAQYPASDGSKDKVSGVLLDLHTRNVIVNNDGFHFIDKDVIYGSDLDKSLVLLRRLGNNKLYKDLLAYYKLKDKSAEYDSYPLNNMNSAAMKKAKYANAELFAKYLTGDGLEEYKGFEIKLTVDDTDIPEDIRSHIDVKWYEKMYPDFKKDNMCGGNASYHYMTIGWKKGYNPSPDFDGNQYLKDYPDVMKSKTNPLQHYLSHGKKEGRKAVKVKG